MREKHKKRWQRKGAGKAFLQLGLDLVGLEDGVELGGEHDGTLGLDLSRHEQLLSVGLALGQVKEVLVVDVDGDIGLETGNGADGDGASAVLQVKGPGA